MASTTTDRRFGVNVGQAIKVPVKAASATNITLDGGTTTTVDGVSVNTTDTRILVTGQTDATENGIYLWRSGAWVRSPDFDGTYDVVGGTVIPVVLGDTYADSLWYVNNTYGVVTIDTDNISFGILAWGWANLSITNTRILKAGTNGAPADTLWTESTGGTISPVTTGQAIENFEYRGYWETVQTATSSTAAGLQFALRDGNVIYHKLTQNTTLLKPSDWPTSSASAASFTMYIAQNATNGYTLSYSTAAGIKFDFGDGTTHGMSTGTDKVDTITGYGLGSTAPTIHMVTAITGGSSYT